MTTDLDWPATQHSTSAAADQPAPSPSQPTLIQQVRQHIAAAKATGRPAPGRPTLVRLTGATDHQVRRTLAILAQEDEDPATSTLQQSTHTPDPRPGLAPARTIDSTTARPAAPAGASARPANASPIASASRATMASGTHGACPQLDAHPPTSHRLVLGQSPL